MVKMESLPLPLSCSEFGQFIALDERILFGKFVLVLLPIVEVALVVLSISVLSTEHVFTFADKAKQSNFLFARPACILVSLD